ncbi:hypothetical protein HN011_006663 [Eciton burchellii]|jgi:DNA-directed RNA polymerase III subunit RPC11|nr:hypothetical protein HN011_006663 [Eciton burchellii]
MVFCFCTFCGYLLKFKQDLEGNQFACSVCSYIYKITLVRRRIDLQGKSRVDVIDAESTWSGVDTTDERCPKCSHPRAYFKQIQIRSGDEPMSQFYKCCNYVCGYIWRVD